MVEKKARKDVEQGKVMTFGRNGEGGELELDMMPIRFEDNVTVWLTFPTDFPDPHPL